MKKVLVTLLAVVLVSAAALAQEKREMKHQHGMMKKHQHGVMMKQLNFSEAQKNQAKANHQEFRQKMQQLNKNEGMTVKDFRDRKAALRKEQKAKMDGLLTPEQKTKMAQLQKEHQIKKNEHFAKHLDKMKTKIGLTDDQVSKLKAQRESKQSRLMTIKGNETLTREQKRDQLMALKKETMEQHRKIFTEEQLKKMESLKHKHMENQPVDTNSKPNK